MSLRIPTLWLWLLAPSFGDTLINSLGMQMVPINAGRFMMGSPSDEKGHQDDEIQRQVTLTEDFFIGSTEVTQGQWSLLMGTSFADLINKQEGPLGRGAKLSSKPPALGDDQPMCFVNWHDAVAFCEALTKREHEAGTLDLSKIYQLPTEAQWEYACRAGTTTPFSTGNVFTSKEGNFYGKLPYGTKELGEYRETTCSVGSFPPNAWGLYDMHGNLYEWVSDWYIDKPESLVNPVGPTKGDGRIIRGGAWDRKATSCRSAYRYSRDPNRRAHNIGFRVVITAKP